MNRKQFIALVQFLLKIFAKVEFKGTEFVPKTGGVIITTNHQSRIDTPILAINPARPDISALVAESYRKSLIFRFLLGNTGVIWIDRTQADFKAMRAGIQAIQKGVAMGIAPEGTRSKTGQLMEGKSGAVLLAMKANVPIVPVAIIGTKGALKKIVTLKHPHILVRFGPAYQLTAINPANRETDLVQKTDEIMCRIAALLPEEYQGFYKDHPRTKEIMEENKLLSSKS